jgi:hypothetical protein
MRERKKKKKTSEASRLPMFDLYGQSPSFLIYGEDSHGTTFGCILSVFVVITMMVVSFLYIRQFILKLETTVTETLTAGSTYPEISLADTGFFFSFLWRGKDGYLHDYNDIEDEFLRITPYHVIVKGTDQKKGEVEIERTTMQLKGCNEIYDETQVSEYDGEDGDDGEVLVLGADARCLFFERERKIEGKYGDPVLKYMEIVIEPCREDYDTCLTRGLKEGDTYQNSPKLREAFHELRNLDVMFSFLDASSDADNFDNPLKLNINSDHTFKIDMFSEKEVHFYIGNYEVDTKYGLFYRTSRSPTDASVNLKKVWKDQTHREPTSLDIETFSANGEEVNKPAPYITIKIFSSNINTKVEREYETIIDAFGNIGGFAESIAFLVAILLYCHGDVRYEQRILNDGLLREKREEEEREKQELEKSGLLKQSTKTVQFNQHNEDGSLKTVTKVYKVIFLLTN